MEDADPTADIGTGGMPSAWAATDGFIDIRDSDTDRSESDDEGGAAGPPVIVPDAPGALNSFYNLQAYRPQSMFSSHTMRVVKRDPVSNNIMNIFETAIAKH